MSSNSSKKYFFISILSIMLFFMSTNVFALDIELRTYKNRVCYDGDTCYITIPVLPSRLKKMSVRILGIDTPEIRGKCPEEKNLALRARIFANKVFKEAKNIEYKNLRWGKYGGRLLSNVYLDGKLYSNLVIEKGLARPYDGGIKHGWCK